MPLLGKINACMHNGRLKSMVETSHQTVAHRRQGRLNLFSDFVFTFSISKLFLNCLGKVSPIIKELSKSFDSLGIILKKNTQDFELFLKEGRNSM